MEMIRTRNPETGIGNRLKFPKKRKKEGRVWSTKKELLKSNPDSPRKRRLAKTRDQPVSERKKRCGKPWPALKKGDKIFRNPIQGGTKEEGPRKYVS